MKPLHQYHGSPSKHEGWAEYADHSLDHDDLKKRITLREMRRTNHITTPVRRTK